MRAPSREVKQRLSDLEKHLKNENQLLVDVVKSFRNLDKVGYRLGYLRPAQSFAFQVPWWPLVSILGTFSAGKSSFLNRYLQYKLQESGTQAVDDKFTVICYSKDSESRSLPGIALDADPRFPFYQMREELEKVSTSEGARIDSYLQLKTCPSERLQGQIFIDSPGFDADAQRTATLRITDHIMNLSDLVLVLFDARRPEPGAMRDTLQHLVGNTVHRSDASKFLYILNQIDTTATEDNPEEVVGAWQRAIAQEGLTAGKFYTIYNADLARPIVDDAVRDRLNVKSDADTAEIHERIGQVKVERFYRIVANLDATAHRMEDDLIPRLTALKKQWRRGVAWRSAAFLLPLIVALVILALYGSQTGAGWWSGITNSWPPALFVTSVLVVGLLWIYASIKKRAALSVRKTIADERLSSQQRDGLENAFDKNTRFRNSVLRRSPTGWGRGSRKKLREVLSNSDRYVQELNNRFTNPSGQAATKSIEVQAATQDGNTATSEKSTEVIA